MHHDNKKEYIVISSYMVETQPHLTLSELCLACETTPEFIEELIAQGMLDISRDHLTPDYHFDSDTLRRIRTIIHLQRDLELNLPGAILAVNLIEELEKMRKKMTILEKYLLE